MTTWGGMAGQPEDSHPGTAIRREDLEWLVGMAENTVYEEYDRTALERLNRIRKELGL